jgi:hypothetical protein
VYSAGTILDGLAGSTAGVPITLITGTPTILDGAYTNKTPGTYTEQFTIEIIP